MGREKILLIEDEADILEAMEYNLRREGYLVISARDGETGLALARKEKPHLVLLDLMLPGVDGVEVCRRLQLDPETRTIHVVMVTAKGEESDVVLGLGVGADDYIVKPFNIRELVARVQAVLRRGPLREEGDKRSKLQIGDVSIDTNRHEVIVDGENVPFTATELRLLHFLACRPGRVFTRDQLVNRVIGEHAVVTDRNIDVHVRSIRRKLGEHRDLIETIRGVGYRFRDAEDS
jgi:DNA-binding response OmpR family regulator